MANDTLTFSNAGSGTAGNTITFAERMLINASGNVGIGTSSPTTKLHVAGRAGAFGITDFDNTLALDSDFPGIAFGDTAGDGMFAVIRSTSTDKKYNFLDRRRF
jgi:hypothetical protein